MRIETENIKKTENNIAKIINHMPGTLIYRGKKSEPFRLELYAFNSNCCIQETFDSFASFEDYLSKANTLNESIKWVNITGINNVEEIKLAGHYFEINKLILEQILSINNHTICKQNDQYIFNDIQMIYAQNETIQHENISIYMNNAYIVTFQERQGDVFDSVRERIINAKGIIRDSSLGYTYFALIDSMVDNYMNALEILRVDIEEMEALITNLETLNVTDVHDIRKNLMLLKFSINPVDRLFQQLITNPERLGIQYKDYVDSLFEHIKEVQNELLIQKESIDGLFENYMLNNSNDMNSIMTTLTIFSAIFIPLSFLAGVFGMNFTYIPGLSSPNGFFYFLLGCLITTVSMVTFFKIKKWF